MLSIRTILHPTDFSQGADHAWQVACALARDYRAKLIVLHVQAPPVLGYGEFGMLPLPEPARAELDNQLAKVQPTDPNQLATRFLAQGDGPGEIIRFAKEHGCDLIVMGTHGRRGLGRLLMGSVAEAVVRKAACPVLVVKNPIGELETNIACEQAPEAVAK